jgi:hypothetical protein
MEKGDKRTVSRFAIFPVKVEGKWIFLEWYYAKQICEIVYYEEEFITMNPFAAARNRAVLTWSTYDRIFINK